MRGDRLRRQVPVGIGRSRPAHLRPGKDPVGAEGAGARGVEGEARSRPGVHRGRAAGEGRQQRAGVACGGAAGGGRGPDIRVPHGGVGPGVPAAVQLVPVGAALQLRLQHDGAGASGRGVRYGRLPLGDVEPGDAQAAPAHGGGDRRGPCGRPTEHRRGHAGPVRKRGGRRDRRLRRRRGRRDGLAVPAGAGRPAAARRRALPAPGEALPLGRPGSSEAARGPAAAARAHRLVAEDRRAERPRRPARRGAGLRGRLRRVADVDRRAFRGPEDRLAGPEAHHRRAGQGPVVQRLPRQRLVLREPHRCPQGRRGVPAVGGGRVRPGRRRAPARGGEGLRGPAQGADAEVLYRDGAVPVDDPGRPVEVAGQAARRAGAASPAGPGAGAEGPRGDRRGASRRGRRRGAGGAARQGSPARQGRPGLQRPDRPGEAGARRGRRRGRQGGLRAAAGVPDVPRGPDAGLGLERRLRRRRRCQRGVGPVRLPPRAVGAEVLPRARRAGPADRRGDRLRVRMGELP